MTRYTTLEQFLNFYPKFFYPGSDGNHYKYAELMSDAWLAVKNQRTRVDLANRLERPIKIWREQASAHQYTIHWEVNLTNIKEVKFFEGANEVTAYSSGTLDEGTDTYSNSYPGYSATTIPTSTYHIEVTDYDENTFGKGIPENETALGDIYDHDAALDLLGARFSVPRRIYVELANNADLSQTSPQYCTEPTEPDYYYEKRIINYMENVGTVKQAILELEKLYDIPPVVEGRWRSICHINEDVMVHDESASYAKYVQTDEWNPAVVDISVDLDKIPINLDVVSGDVATDIMRQASPMSKKFYFNLLGHFSDDYPHLLEHYAEFRESFNFRLIFPEQFGFGESISFTVTNWEVQQESFGFSDSVKFTLLGLYYNIATDEINEIDILNPTTITKLGNFVFSSTDSGKYIDIDTNHYFN